MTPVTRIPAGLRYGRAFPTARTVKHPSEGPTWLNLVNNLHTPIQPPFWRAKMCASPSGEPRCSLAAVILLPSGGSRSLRNRTAHETEHAVFEVRKWQRLCEDVCQLSICRYTVEAHVTVLNHLVGGVFANVDALGTFASADDMVSPLDAGRLVFIDWRIIALWKYYSINCGDR